MDLKLLNGLLFYKTILQKKSHLLDRFLQKCLCPEFTRAAELINKAKSVNLIPEYSNWSTAELFSV